MKKLITSNDLVRYFKWSPLTKPLVALALNIMGFRKINRLYSPSADLKNKEFTVDMLQRYIFVCHRISPFKKRGI